jgi:hypothetical protein
VLFVQVVWLVQSFGLVSAYWWFSWLLRAFVEELREELILFVCAHGARPPSIRLQICFK